MAAIPEDGAAVERFLLSLGHPRQHELESVRRLILDADPVISEGIKWNAPSCRVREYFATFNLRSQDTVQLILHLGAKARPDIAGRDAAGDPAGMLRWLGKDRAVVSFIDRGEIESRGSALQDVVREWITHLK